MSRKKEQGNIVVVLLISVFALLVVTQISKLSSFRMDSLSTNIDRSSERLHLTNQIEMLFAKLKTLQLNYLNRSHECDQTRDFISSLLLGHGCQGLGSINVSDLDTGDPDGVAVSECQIHESSSDCLEQETFAVISYLDETHSVRLATIIPESNIIEFAIQPHRRAERFRQSSFFSIQLGGFTTLHLESSTAKLVSENPILDQRGCPTTPWSQSLIPSGTGCVASLALGMGTGLARATNHYVVLRSHDGYLLDPYSLESESPLIDTDGFRNSIKVTSPYCPNSLIGADDIAIIKVGDEDQIYYAQGQGPQAHIGYMKYNSAGNCTKVPICVLGAMGWGQGMSGLLATPASEGLDPGSFGDKLPLLTAQFYIKTDLGQRLNVTVASSEQPLNLAGGQEFFSSALNRHLSCFANYDPEKQVLEYRRTLGFARGGTNDRPYFIF